MEDRGVRRSSVGPMVHLHQHGRKVKEEAAIESTKGKKLQRPQARIRDGGSELALRPSQGEPLAFRNLSNKVVASPSSFSLALRFSISF